MTKLTSSNDTRRINFTQMEKQKTGLLSYLSGSLWWVCILGSVISYALFTGLLPTLFTRVCSLCNTLYTDQIELGLRTFLPVVLMTSVTLFIVWFIVSAIRSQLQQNNAKDNLKNLNKREFASVLVNYYQKQGYLVKMLVHSNVESESEMDIEVTKFGQSHLIYCQHRKTRRVETKVVKEYYNRSLSQQADRITIVSLGEFTLNAQQLALSKNIDLINGTQLAKMLQPLDKLLPKNKEEKNKEKKNQKQTLASPQN